MKINLGKIFTIFIVIAFFLLMRLIMSGSASWTVWANDNYCKTQWDTEFRGTDIFGDYCEIPLYETKETIKEYYTEEDIDRLCGVIPYWKLNKWWYDC